MTTYRCSICASDRRALVDAFLSAGKSMNWIEREMKRLEKPTKSETVSKHFNICLRSDKSNTALLEAAATGRATGLQGDFAAAVQKVALEKLAAGELRIKTQDGLAAQALLDRRAEKAADRSLMVEIAALLSGARVEVPSEVIEGEWSEVEQRAISETSPDSGGLAPLRLVASESD